MLGNLIDPNVSESGVYSHANSSVREMRETRTAALMLMFSWY